jgi:hypothetical protein
VTRDQRLTPSYSEPPKGVKAAVPSHLRLGPTELRLRSGRNVWIFRYRLARSRFSSHTVWTYFGGGRT